MERDVTELDRQLGETLAQMTKNRAAPDISYTHQGDRLSISFPEGPSPPPESQNGDSSSG